MKRVKAILYLFLLVSTVIGQQIIDPYMIEIPTNKIKYYNEGIKSVEVNTFYISQFPESVEQYKIFLNYLEKKDKIIELKNALPKTENLKKCFLSSEEIHFIREEYLKNEIYNHYPIVGLDFEQINTYLNWKIDTFGTHVFSINGFDIKDQSYFNLMENHRDTIDFTTPISYKIALSIHLISALKSKINGTSLIPNYYSEYPDILRTEVNLNYKNVKNKILKKLEISNICEYDLLRKNKYKNIRETILDLDDNKLKIMRSNKGKKIRIIDSASIFIRPWRMSVLKIKPIHKP